MCGVSPATRQGQGGPWGRCTAGDASWPCSSLGPLGPGGTSELGSAPGLQGLGPRNWEGQGHRWPSAGCCGSSGTLTGAKVTGSQGVAGGGSVGAAFLYSGVLSTGTCGSGRESFQRIPELPSGAMAVGGSAHGALGRRKPRCPAKVAAGTAARAGQTQASGWAPLPQNPGLRGAGRGPSSGQVDSCLLAPAGGI